MAAIPDIPDRFFLRMADIPYLFCGVNTRWGPAYVADKIQSTLPPPPPPTPTHIHTPGIVCRAAYAPYLHSTGLSGSRFSKIPEWVSDSSDQVCCIRKHRASLAGVCRACWASSFKNSD